MKFDIDRILDEAEMINDFRRRNMLIEQNIDELLKCIEHKHEANESSVQKFRLICQTIQ